MPYLLRDRRERRLAEKAAADEEKRLAKSKNAVNARHRQAVEKYAGREEKKLEKATTENLKAKRVPRPAAKRLSANAENQKMCAENSGANQGSCSIEINRAATSSGAGRTLRKRVGTGQIPNKNTFVQKKARFKEKLRHMNVGELSVSGIGKNNAVAD